MGRDDRVAHDPRCAGVTINVSHTICDNDSVKSLANILSLAALAIAALAAPAVQAHDHGQGAAQHAHTHGVVALDVAVDAQTITLQLEAPLESLVGFERAPRTAAERQRVDAAVAQLRAGDRLFRLDPAARCVLKDVDLQSPAIGLGKDGKGHDPKHDHGEDSHADLDATYTFACDAAAQARFVELPLFDAFPRIRSVAGQVAAPQGQFKRTLGRTDRRLGWGR
ncbi:MAG: DUF2796 domain-containing protein [Burkholderiales bacterium]|nr:DUF2796 domain-containing protein [Burkholderiales bacterium]